MTSQLLRRRRTTARRSFHPATIRDFQARRSTRALTLEWNARRDHRTSRSLLISLLWGVFVGGLTLLCLAPWARANTVSASPEAMGGWKAKGATATKPTTEAVKLIPVPSSASSMSSSNSTSSGGALKWRPAYVPQLAPGSPVATPDPIESAGAVIRTNFANEDVANSGPSLGPIIPIAPTTSRATGEWVPKGSLPAAGATIAAPSVMKTVTEDVRSTSLPAISTAQRKPPTFLEELAAVPQPNTIDCTVERSKLKRIGSLTHKIAAEPGEFPPECGLDFGPYRPRAFDVTAWTWKASNLCHKPLYFEEVRLERYGHSLPPFIQPVASAAHFFVSVPLLPYKMGLELPNECVYTLGYYRPGSCAPYHIPGIPLSVRGALFEAGLVGGLFLVH